MRRRHFHILIAASLAGISLLLMAGCGGGVGNSMIPLASISEGVPGASSSDQPSARLTDLSRGASWDYVTYPGETSIHSGAGTGSVPMATGHKYMVLAPAGSAMATSNGFGSLDTNIPGALLRLEKVVPHRERRRITRTTRRIMPTREPSGKTRSAVMFSCCACRPGSFWISPRRCFREPWNNGVHIHSQFLVGGVVQLRL